MSLHIALLGPPRVDVDGRPLVVDTRKAIALLAYLAVVDRPVARDTLADLLWPDAEPESARGALRRTLSALRSGLNGPWLEVNRRQVALRREDVEVDVRALRAGLAEDGPALATVLARYNGGAFLEGFALRDSVAFDEWQLLEGEALADELREGFRRLVEAELAAGRPSAAVVAARRLVALDPIDERGHRALMRALAANADHAGLERAERDLRKVLQRELGVEPSPETEALFASLREARGSATGDEGEREQTTEADTEPDRPTEADDDVLAIAALLGEEVDPDLVRDAAGRTDRETAAALEGLVAAGTLREPAPGEPPDRYRFANSRVRGDVTSRLGIARRRALSTRVAQTLRAAAERARAANRLADAVAHARSALGLGDPDPVGLHELIGDAETLRGRYGVALAAYEQGAALADGVRVARLEHRLGSLHLRRGALDLADLHLAAALGRIGQADPKTRARLLADRSLVALRRGDADDATRLARSAMRAARAAQDPLAESQAHNLLGILARRAGDPGAAARHLRRGLTVAKAGRAVSAEVAALNNLALLERAEGRLDEALALGDEALRRCVLAGDRHREAALRNNRADLLHLLGRTAESAEELRRAVEIFAVVGEPPNLEPEIWKLVDW